MSRFEKVLPFGSWFFSLYFFVFFHVRIGWSPKTDLDSTSLIYLAISIIFLLLPLAKRINIGKFFEYEAKVQEIKTEMKDFKDETRQLLTIYTSLTNTISNTVSQSVTVNLPGRDELDDAREYLDETVTKHPEPSQINREFSEFLASNDFDQNLALAKLRMDIESELRRILGKKLITNTPLEMKSRFLSARSLFREFTKASPKHKGMGSSFDFVLKICNAAIHGQKVPEGYAQEALGMGIKILDELSTVMEV